MIIRAPDAVHVGLFASTGAGKGVSYLIPQLLSQPGGFVVLDPQGSLYGETAAHRRKRFGHTVVRLDSSELCGPGADGLNPLDYIRADADDCLDRCRDMAALLISRTGKESDPHWNDSAERVLAAFIYFIATCETDPENRNLLSVRQIVSSRDTYLASMNIMRQGSGLLKQQGDSLTWLADRELNSVLAVVQRQTAWMDSPAAARALKRSTFRLEDLRHGRLTIYVIQSPDRLVTMAPQLRLYLGTMLSVLTRGKASEKNPVWFMIDETAALGRMQVLENAVTTLRGFGIRLFLVYQSPGQLEHLYGENAQTILDNLGTQIYFAMRSHESCDHISKLIGDATVDITTGSEQTGTSRPTGPAMQPTPGSASSSTSRNYSQLGRRWATPDEIRTLPEDMALVFTGRMHVIPVKRLRYFDSPVFTSRILRRRRTGKLRGLGLAGFAAASLCLLVALVATAATGVLIAAAPHQRRPAAARVPATQSPSALPFFDPASETWNGAGHADGTRVR